MTANPFTHALSDMGERLAALTTRAAQTIRDDLALAREASAGIWDDRLRRVHWDLLLTDLALRLSRESCAACDIRC